MTTSATTLLIQSAIHGELRVPLAGAMAVGRALSADVVLGDASLAGMHFRLGTVGGVVVEAVGGELVFEDGQRLAPGQSRTLSKTTGFHAGTVPMQLEMPGVVRASAPKTGRLHLLIATATVALIASAAMAITNVAASPAQQAAATPNIVSKAKVAQESLLPLILAELRARNLDAIQIEQTVEGSYKATGAIDHAAQTLWQEVKHWSDSAFAGQAVLVDAVSVGSKMPVLSVQSAWLGDAPYIIDGGGQKLFSGAVIADGWTIEGIEAGKIRVRRQAQHVVIRF